MNKKITIALCVALVTAVVILGVMLSDQKRDNAALAADVAALNGQVESLTGDVTDRDAQIEALTGDVTDRDAQIEALTGDVTDRDAQIEALTGDVTERDAKIEELNGSVADLTVQLAEAEAATSTAILGDTGADDVTCKGTYTTYEAKAVRARGNVVAVSGGRELTNGLLQVFYRMEISNFNNTYGAYTYLLGLDATKPLDAQMFGNVTWQQYFLNNALTTWSNFSAMAAEADARGLSIGEGDEDPVAAIAADLEATALQNGYASADEMVAASMGAGVTVQDYLDYVTMYLKYNACVNALRTEVQPDAAAADAWFVAHEEEYAQAGLTRDTITVDVRHILIFPQGANSSNARTTQWPEEAWAAAEERANAILLEWSAGEATAESFGALAVENSQDTGSAGNGGLYTGVTKGQMVEAFDAWCFDPARRAGDTGVVRTEYGYHVMYFVGTAPAWEARAMADCASDAMNTAVTAICQASSPEIRWAEILLTNVVMS